RFEDWAKAEPLQKRSLSLFPDYIEPTKTRVVDGLKANYVEKLSMYVIEARFLLAKSTDAIDLASYASVPFLTDIDASISHKVISAEDAMPANNTDYASNRNPVRQWCGEPGQLTCIESRYMLEGRLPAAIHLANMLMDGKKHANYLEF